MFPGNHHAKGEWPWTYCFFNSNSTCIVLSTTYSKSRSLKNIVKKCDRLTSQYILYYILVVKTIQIKMFKWIGRKFGYDYGTSFTIRVDVTASATIVESNELSPEEYSEFVCSSFLFIENSEDKSMSYKKFARQYEALPSGLFSYSRLNFKETRHGMIALQRLLVKDSKNSSLLDIIERITGHSVLTVRDVYEVNDIDRCRSSVDNERFLVVPSQ